MSARSEYLYSLSETSFMKSFLSSDFTIGMRTTKVTIDRGGWFDAGILALTPSCRRLKETISGGKGLSFQKDTGASGTFCQTHCTGWYQEGESIWIRPGAASFFTMAPVSFSKGHVMIRHLL